MERGWLEMAVKKPSRTFTGNETAASLGNNGPTGIKNDIDALCNMFDPAATHTTGEAGGIQIGNLALGEATATPTPGKLVLYDPAGNTPGTIVNAANAVNVTATIDGQALGDIFEVDKLTVKEATHANNADTLAALGWNDLPTASDVIKGGVTINANSLNEVDASGNVTTPGAMKLIYDSGWQLKTGGGYINAVFSENAGTTPPLVQVYLAEDSNGSEMRQAATTNYQNGTHGIDVNNITDSGCRIQLAASSFELGIANNGAWDTSGGYTGDVYVRALAFKVFPLT